MKSRTHANRGMPLEDLIKFANERYRHHGLACINKQATEFIPIRDRTGKIASCKVEEKATVDFIGRYKHYPIAIEAKHSADNSIRFDRIEPHQADFMDDFTSPGTIGLVLVSFQMKRFFVIPWAFWKAAYNARVRPGASRTTPVTVSALGVSWTIPNKFSVREDELEPSWEIPNHDFTFGLHYLKRAEEYITPTATLKTE